MSVLDDCKHPDDQFHEHPFEHDYLVDRVDDELVFKRYHCNDMCAKLALLARDLLIRRLNLPKKSGNAFTKDRIVETKLILKGVPWFELFDLLEDGDLETIAQYFSDEVIDESLKHTKMYIELQRELYVKREENNWHALSKKVKLETKAAFATKMILQVMY